MAMYLKSAYIIVAQCCNPDCNYLDTNSHPAIGKVFRSYDKAHEYVRDKKPIKCVSCGHTADICFDDL